MDIKRYDPWEDFNRLQQQINHLIAGFFDNLPHAGRHIAFAPAVDIYQSDDYLVLRIELPGVVEDDVDIEATESAIVIRGERDAPADVSPGGYYNHEWTYGFFERRIDLPVLVKPRQIHAQYTDGVFLVRLPLA